MLTARALLSGMLLCCLAAAEDYSVRVWRMRDGLPHDRVRDIAQTPDGYIWIGTPGGLARFDGVRFTVFNRSNTSAFHDDSVLALCAAPDGSVWIGTDGGGLVRHRNGAFKAFTAEQGLTNGFVRAVHADKRGAVWAGTDRGLFRIEGEVLRRVDGNAEFPWISVMSIAEDASGRVWIGGSELVVAEAGRLRRVAPFGPNPLPRVSVVRPARDGAMWIVAPPGIYVARDGVLTRAPEGRVAPAAAIRNLAEDRAGKTWTAAGRRGLLRDGYSLTDLLPDQTVLSVFEDHDRNIWAGAVDGLVRLSATTVTTINGKDGLDNDHVATIYSDPARSMWITTFSGGAYTLEGPRAVRFGLPASAAKMHVRTVFRDSRGALWIGTSGQGVLRILRGSVKRYTAAHGLRNDYIRAFHEDQSGAIWIGTDSGVSRWDGTAFRNYYVEDGLPYGSIRTLAADGNGDVLVGTDRGAGRIRDDAFVADPIFQQIGPERIWAIHRDTEGGLWLGSRGGGLFRVKNGSLFRFSARHGLPSSTVFGLVEDQRGYLWISSGMGLFRVSRAELDRVAEGRSKSFAALPYGFVEGVEPSQMWGGIQPSACRASDGSLWFATIKGAVRVDPDRVETGTQPPVLIESVVADDQPAYLNGGPVRLEPGRGKLEIQYTAFNLRAPERIRFRYILEGFEDTWTDADTRRVAYYTNLPPGEYRFRVMAHDAGVEGQPSEASVLLNWAPHLYQTPWFYGLGALVVAAVGVFALRMHSRQAEGRYRLILAERNRVAREMHDTVIQGCVGVSALLEAASSNRGMADDLVDRARDQIRITLQEAREAVWDLRKASFGKGIVDALSDFASELSRGKGIAVATEITGTPAALDARVSRGVLLVAKEAIRNAVAHGNPRQVQVRLSFQASELRLEVVDNGTGFQGPDSESVHYGIAGMRERIEQLGGRFELDSARGIGTRVAASVPLEAASE